MVDGKNIELNILYDLNGNLLYDGLRAFAYDDENQLISVTVTNAWQSQFVYDGKLRRRVRREYTWSLASTNWVQTNEIHYIYDKNVVIQERDINNLPVTTYTRGRDLSGSLQGAGGIGGMLAMSQPSTVNPQHYYYHADGNGNITAMVNAQQIIVAKYLFDAFGNILSMSGPMAAANSYRFSSKEFHQNSGLVYYLYRYFDPHFQRWLNRDPLTGGAISADANELMDNALRPFEFYNGANLYESDYNDSVNQFDPLGLDVWIIKCSTGWGHEWVMGNNPDGTYWDSDFHPDTASGWGLNCKGKVNFNNKSGMDPNSLKSTDPCLSIVRHIRTSPTVDVQVKGWAKRQSEAAKQRRYDALGHNCRDYCNDAAGYAEAAQITENLH